MDEAGLAYGYNLDGLSGYGTSAPTEGYGLSGGFVTDMREAAKLDPFVPATQGDARPWWDRVAEYGITRAIDSHYGVTSVNKTGTPGTFAGQNGRTYTNGIGAGGAAAVGGVSPLLLVAAVVALVVLLK